MAALPLAATIRKAQSKIGYKFNNALYLWEALQAPGSIVRSGEIEGAGIQRHSVGFQRFPDGNRRLAALGDTVLKLALVEVWYKGEDPRERLSRVIEDVGSNVNLNRVGRRNGLDALINKNPSQHDVSVSKITVASTVEAVIAAVYLDSDMKSVTVVMQNLGLMPRIVRRTRMEVRSLKSAKSPAASTSTVDNHQKTKTTPKDSKEAVNSD